MAKLYGEFLKHYDMSNSEMKFVTQWTDKDLTFVVLIIQHEDLIWNSIESNTMYLPEYCFKVLENYLILVFLL